MSCYRCYLKSRVPHCCVYLLQVMKGEDKDLAEPLATWSPPGEVEVQADHISSTPC